jgi:hypothetical protein
MSKKRRNKKHKQGKKQNVSSNNSKVYFITKEGETQIVSMANKTLQETVDLMFKIQENGYVSWLEYQGKFYDDVTEDGVLLERVTPTLLDDKGKELTTTNTTNKTTNTTNTTTYASWRKDCHVVTEIVPNLFLGGRWDIKEIIEYKPDVLVPLASCPATIWDMGWRGFVFGLPITDYDVLPDDVLKWAVENIIEYINKGYKVAIFCEGGHGRTGYLASCVIGKMNNDIEDPIKYIREKYCKSTVEAQVQINHISKFLDKPELTNNKPSSFDRWAGASYGYGSHDYSKGYSNAYATTSTSTGTNFYNTNRKSTKYDYKVKCSECAYFNKTQGINSGECSYHNEQKSTYAFVCDMFIDMSEFETKDKEIENATCFDCQEFFITDDTNSNKIKGWCEKTHLTCYSDYAACNKYIPYEISKPITDDDIININLEDEVLK